MTISTGRLDRRTKKDDTISPVHWRVIKNIQEIRNSLKLTQKDMAKILEVAQPTYCALETGRNDMMLKTLERIAKALKQPVQVFFIREPSEKQPALRKARKTK